MNTKVLLHFGGGSNLILGTGREKNFSNNSSRNQFFSSNSQKMTLWCKKKSLPTQMHLYSPYVVPPTLFPRGILIFQGVLTKFNFSMKFPQVKKNCRFNEIPKI